MEKVANLLSRSSGKNETKHSPGPSYGGNILYSEQSYMISGLKPKYILKDADGGLYVMDAEIKSLLMHDRVDISPFVGTKIT